MSIEDDVVLLERVPTLRLLGSSSLRMLAIGSEQKDIPRGDYLFKRGDEADAGFVVQRGALRVEDGSGAEVTAGPGALIGELALVVAMRRPSNALALEYSSVVRISRSLFQRVLESDPAAAVRLRDEFALRSSQIASDILIAGAKLYRQMCSRCHGTTGEPDNTYGQSFYPPAPHLPLIRTLYTDNEMFWIVKHGIRNTAMLAWGNLLSDDEIWQIVTLIRKFDSLPESATLELLRHHP